MLWRPAYVGLGSNLDDPAARVRSACAALARLSDCRLVARSRLWHSAPLGPADQPDYVNAVAGLLTTLGPAELLAELRALEARLGKVAPPVRWGPRRIDLDLLLFGDLQLGTEALRLPHPGLHLRNFVLYPLAEVAPDLWVPGHGRVRALAERVGSDGIRPFGA
ncbi:MAG: 2-amino-4-hydroxy-6-hydroxymethyldihydropteridine diphosphokinase [Gammaproteobacteria bacterium]|nr:2-amino-4-hydroxy-6-hydroxymethyldihydropteridine diphosphokinase [Gammaproteobacteria bacterium]